MNKHALTKFTKNITATLSKHSPEILMGVGITGMLTTVVLAVKATPKAVELIEDKKVELDVETLPPVEVVKATWKCYVPAAATATASIACLIGSHSVSSRRHTALAAAYKLSEKAFSDYRTKVVEVIGDKKERTVHDKVSEEHVKNNPVNRTEIIVTGKGKSLFFDPLSSRYFYSDMERIKRAENNLNHRILTAPFHNEGVTVNDFYAEIGLPATDVGESLGWNLDIGLIDIYPSPQMADEGSDHEGEPCAVLNFTNPPKYDSYC